MFRTKTVPIWNVHAGTTFMFKRVPRGSTKEEVWRGVRAPLGELSNRLKDDKLIHTNPNFACGYIAQDPSAVSGTVFGNSIGASST